MERKLPITFFIYMFYQLASGDVSDNVMCGKHEAAVNCPTICPNDFCPTSESQNLTCPDQTCDPNATACKCMFNYRRAENGTCIRTEDCPPFECEDTERYVACPAYCPTDSCADVQYNGQCPTNILIILECFPQCQCKEGFARDNGICIPQELCPPKSTNQEANVQSESIA